MKGLIFGQSKEAHENLNFFLKRWPLEKIKSMSLSEYNSVGNKDSFCYWLEHITQKLGRISGTPSNKFGIWQIADFKEGTSDDFLDDKVYKWYRKYGETSKEAFRSIRNLIIEIVESSQLQKFNKIDQINYFSLAKWKVAFIYSDYNLLPIYKKQIVKQIAENFEYADNDTSPMSAIYRFIILQKDEEQDFFDFASQQYQIALQNRKRDYYVLGSKYGDDKGNNVVDMSPKMYSHNAIATGFFWNEDLSHLYGKPLSYINKWLDGNLKIKYPDKYENSRRTISFFLKIKAGDIIAIKSHGQYGDLTLIAYAEVIEVNNITYYHSTENGLGHCINVNFLETHLYKNVKLSYGRTIHRVVPNQKEGHFQKIFGNYIILDNDEKEDKKDIQDFELLESRINEKQTDSRERTVSYTATVKKIHNRIQSAFALRLQKTYPNDVIRTEYKFIDILRQNDQELFYYEVKPYNTAYYCIRRAIGQLLDYYYSNPHSKKKINLVVVGSAPIEKSDKEFIDFIKSSINLEFDYISFDDF